MVPDSSPSDHGASRRPELYAALAAAERWLDSASTRRVPASTDSSQVARSFAAALAPQGQPATDVIVELAAAVEPGLVASVSPRFFGWVVGGTLPAALAADWLVSAWDQNAGMRGAAPGVVAAEDAAARWILDALGLPSGAGVGFVTGGTMANFTGIAAARDALLASMGWDLDEYGLRGAPELPVLAGGQRHSSIDLALRYLGLGRPVQIPADHQGRMRADALASALADIDGPAIVCAQAGNIHSGAFDPFDELAELAHARGGWLHVDGAFGLWAAASPELARLVGGLSAADSWATDAHKTLNTPYDAGIAIVRDPAALTRAFGHHADYLLERALADPHETVPEMSRRARGVPVWAALRALGRDGLAAQVLGMTSAARRLADGLAELPGVEVLNDVVYTQLSIALRDDDATTATLARILAEGVAHPSGSRWHGRAVIRFSVSNHATDAAAIDATVAAVRRALPS